MAKKKKSRSKKKPGGKRTGHNRKVENGLNAKQRRFALEYLVDSNATQAAIRAGYSKKTAASQGERLLRNAEISRLVAEGQKKTAARLEITRERVLNELAEIGFGVVGLHHEEMGEIDMRMWGKDEAAVAQAKRAALDSIARILGFVAPKKHEHTGPGGGPIETTPLDVLSKLSIETRRAVLAELQAAAEK